VIDNNRSSKAFQRSVLHQGQTAGWVGRQRHRRSLTKVILMINMSTVVQKQFHKLKKGKSNKNYQIKIYTNLLVIIGWQSDKVEWGAVPVVS
jgi:hypothetical protein